MGALTKQGQHRRQRGCHLKMKLHVPAIISRLFQVAWLAKMWVEVETTKYVVRVHTSSTEMPKIIKGNRKKAATKNTKVAIVRAKRAKRSCRRCHRGGCLITAPYHRVGISSRLRIFPFAKHTRTHRTVSSEGKILEIKIYQSK